MLTKVQCDNLRNVLILNALGQIGLVTKVRAVMTKILVQRGRARTPDSAEKRRFRGSIGGLHTRGIPWRLAVKSESQNRAVKPKG